MKNTDKILYMIFSLFTIYFFLAELLSFQYSLNGAWTIRIIMLIWLSLTIYWIIKNWKSRTAKIILMGIILTPILSTFFAGILAMDFLYSIPNLNYYKSQKVGKYYIYENSGFLIGRFLTLYENKIILKRKISTQIEHSNTFFFEDANKFEILFDSSDSLKIKFSKANLIEVITFEK